MAKFNFNKNYGKLNYYVERADMATLFDMLYNHIYNCALNVFEWKGLPDEVKPEYIEYALFNFGQCVFGKKKGGDIALLSQYQEATEFIALPANGTYRYNWYGEPVEWRACGINYSQPYSVLDSVLIRNNYTRMPSIFLISEYVSRMVDVLLACDVNINSSKTPFAVYGDDKLISTVQSIMKENGRNSAALVVDKKLNGYNSRLERVDLDCEYKADKFWQMYKSYESLVYNLLGINALQVEKKERLITDEATAQDEQQDFNVSAGLLCRQKGAEQINAMFGLNVSVDLRYKKEKETENNETILHSYERANA